MIPSRVTRFPGCVWNFCWIYWAFMTIITLIADHSDMLGDETTPRTAIFSASHIIVAHNTPYTANPITAVKTYAPSANIRPPNHQKKAAANPWGEGATTLEWTLPSPPPFHTFAELPQIK